MDKVNEIKVQIHFENEEKNIAKGEISDTYINEDIIIGILSAIGFPVSKIQSFDTNCDYSYKIIEKTVKADATGQVKLF